MYFATLAGRSTFSEHIMEEARREFTADEINYDNFTFSKGSHEN